MDVWVGGRLVFGGLRAAGIIFGRLGVRRLSFSASQRVFGKIARENGSPSFKVLQWAGGILKWAEGHFWWLEATALWFAKTRKPHLIHAMIGKSGKY